jgi:hypothetical protein
VTKQQVVDYTAHLDECHRISAGITRLIRQAVEAKRAEVAAWSPRPCPPRSEFQ